MKTSSILVFIISFVFLSVSGGFACPVSDQAAKDSGLNTNLAAAEFFYGISSVGQDRIMELNRSPAERQETVENAVSGLGQADFYGYNNNIMNTNNEIHDHAVVENLDGNATDRQAAGASRISASEFFYGYTFEGWEAGQCINC